MKHAILYIIAILTLSITATTAQIKNPAARVTGVEVLYESLIDGHRTISQPYGESAPTQITIASDSDTIVVDYALRVFYDARTPKLTSPIVTIENPGQEQAVDVQYMILGWSCIMRQFGDYTVYYTRDMGFGATPAPGIAAPEGCVVVRIEHKYSPLPIYRALSIRQVCY